MVSERMQSLFREPLVHFLAIGAALFLYFHFSGGGSAGLGSTRIVIAGGQIAHLEAGFARTWQRPPTEAELKNLIDEWVKEEIAVREAMAAGLDRDDTVIRRRLRQKLEFLADEAADAAPPTDEELKALFARNAEAFRVEPRLAFRQVFVSADKRGAAAEADATRLLARLSAAGPAARIDEFGDTTMLPGEVPLSALRDIDSQFGNGFAKHLEAIEPGKWAGPIRSGYGLHLVLVREHIEARTADFAVARPMLEREFLTERRKQQLAAMYDRLLAKYAVTIEPRDADASGAPGKAAAR
jgi:hypothetical protein